MAICYDRLWKMLNDKNMNRTELKERTGKRQLGDRNEEMLKRIYEFAKRIE